MQIFAFQEPNCLHVLLQLDLHCFMLFSAPITEEYKKGPLEGRALYLDAQATTPMVLIAIFLMKIVIIELIFGVLIVFIDRIHVYWIK